MGYVKERASEDVRFEREVFAAYGMLCEIFFYTKLVGLASANWDGTSRQAAIQNMVEAQPLYLQPESLHGHDAILMVNANESGVGYLEEQTAEAILKSLRDGREWHAHVRSVQQVGDMQTCEIVVMMLLMIPADRYAELVDERKLLQGFPPPLEGAARKPAKDFNVEWTLFALVLLGVAITML
ncbi:MAG: hypothetical protein ABI197_14520 [Granulicella sp.]